MNVASQQASFLKKRLRRDRLARSVITVFGYIVLLTMVMIIWHLFSQAVKIAAPPGIKVSQEIPVLPGGQFLYVGDTANGQAAVIKGPGCKVSLARLENHILMAKQSLRRPCSHSLGVVSSYGQPYIADISASGQVRLLPVPTVTQPLRQTQFNDTPLANEITFALPEATWQQQQQWQIAMGETWIITLVKTATDTLVQWVNRNNPQQIIKQQYSASQQIVLLPDTRQIVLINNTVLTFVDNTNQRLHQLTVPANVTWADTLVKNRSLFLALDNNQLLRLSVFNQAGILRYQPAYSITLEAGEVPVEMYAHASVNGIALITSKRQLLLINRISGEVVQRKALPFAPVGVSWFDSRVYVYSAQAYIQHQVNNMAGLSTANSLLQPHLYEGYVTADQIWQTSSASDYQEIKMSLVPLLIGSLKASTLALLIAIPLALGAAVYTAYFARPKLRDGVKPVIEMLEAVPSVLIGFIAAIWLAPLAERFLFSFAVFIVSLPVFLLLIALVQHRVAESVSNRLQHIAETVLPVLGIVLLGYVCIVWAPDWLLAAMDVEDFTFLAHNTEVPVGKTTILVAIALGLAISPSIYSLAEDAISGVPHSLRQASYALGATRLQTLRRVVLKVAFPGIVAAIMLGFGRAFGETMIVLMVTGNTPIADWDLFAGLRALTANLAIELPEAEVNSIHYQVLFLTACVLFTFTFIVNTLAELLRHRARKVAGNG
ncbi:ABC transporter permease subunit [Alteromonas lipolytica]|uniref:ABC transmembrane type-1 domain-containing protein n=1 Tax=Alteromonas lipolytica TaxID=1856405 RepID=A0A1E8FE21_9ALTE|nr:ABC transporter permease subunit [Alteromonas lipolytica]OFI33838.1 hypothetical protein BFC17_19915 [Alteromonas lipolytica]GGF67959.1 hypothetical protein GCM10011338_20190 [Alteromonas lipolytica]